MTIDNTRPQIEKARPAPFVEFQPVAPDIDETLFSWFFDGNVFQHWHSDGPTWQLRCIGGPGSGKSALSALTIERLKRDFPTSHAGIASIFFKRTVDGSDDEVMKSFLQSILRQISSNSSHTSISEVHDDDLEGVYTALRYQVKPSRRLFLVVDDLDLCSQKVTAMVEKELTRLQQDLGMSVMVTSRLPHQYDNLMNRCDIVPKDVWHSSQIVSVYWCCSTCEKITSEPLIICQACTRNYVCKICGPETKLYEPYRYVDMLMSISEDSMRSFVAAELEKAHGDLGLSSTCKDKPDRSKLGIALMEGNTTYSSQRILDRIVASVGGNVAMAKLRLEAIDAFQSVDHLLRVGDRLPDNIQTIFDAGISRINEKPHAEAALGLKAILGVATIYGGKPFSELQQWLHRQAALTSSTTTTSCNSIGEVLHAAGGFLICDTWHTDNPVSLYNDAFTHYVAEDYNESFVWVRSEMQFGILPRSSTMAIGTRKVSGASEYSRPKLGPRSPPLMETPDTPVLQRTGTANSQTAPKRQISEPGTLKEDKQDAPSFNLLRRSTNWL